MKKQKGITLIALVITIIILLILAGISIQSITNTGIFEKASQAKKEATRSQIIEWLSLKLLEEQTYNPLGTSEEIIKATRQNVYNNISELQKMGKMITVGDTKTEENGEQVDIYFYVQVDEDVYKVDIKGAQFKSGNVTNIDTTAPSVFTITNTAVGVNSFTLSATFEDNDSGLGKIIWYYKRPQDTTWQSEEVVYTELNGSITESITKTYSVENMTQGGEVQAYAVGYDVAGNSITTTNVNENNPLTFNTETYTISYNANGGEGAPEIQTKYYGVDIQLSSTEPTKEGYHFLGWSADNEATSATFTSNTTYSDNKNEVLYAVWEEHSFTAQNISDEYLASAANCTSGAKYYYACSVCGEKGTTTYVSGSATGHSYGSTSTSWDAKYPDGHRYKYTQSCSVCGTSNVWYGSYSSCSYVHQKTVTVTNYSHGGASGHTIEKRLYKCSVCGFWNGQWVCLSCGGAAIGCTGGWSEWDVQQ